MCQRQGDIGGYREPYYDRPKGRRSVETDEGTLVKKIRSKISDISDLVVLVKELLLGRLTPFK